MSEVIDAPAAPAAAPASAPAAAVPAASAPAAPAAAPALPESLIHDATAAPAAPAAPSAAPAADDPFAALLGQVPEKFHVKSGDKLDPVATMAKALEQRAHLEKRLGAGDLPPKTAAEYAFTPPEELKDFEFNSERMGAFKEQAHKLGFTGEQFEFAMSSFLAAVPDLMQGAAKLTASEARAELQKVWTTSQELDAGVTNAKRALSGLPKDLQEATREFGTNPAFLRAMAYFGGQMREDTQPPNAGASVPAGSREELMRSEAYTNPKHPQHATISAQVAKLYEQQFGNTPI